MSPPFIAAAFIFIFSVISSVNSLGAAASTLAVSYGDATTVCGIVAEQQKQRIQCWRKNRTVNILPETSFESISGGRNIFCGVRSGGYSLICWNETFVPKRIYYSKNVLLKNLTVGDDQICALSDENLKCWRDDDVLAKLPNKSAKFWGISAGVGFSCGVLMNNNSVSCWGGNDENDTISNFIENEFVGLKMLSIVVGGEFACGFNLSGFLICKGRNDSGQLNVPLGFEYEYNAVALGFNFGCVIRRVNSSVVCWGGNGGFSGSNVTDGVSFVSIVAGFNFTCGLTASNFSVICWGAGWDNSSYSLGVELSLPKILPGACLESTCECGLYPQSETLCSGNGNICRSCDLLESFPPVSSPVVYVPSPSSGSKDLKKGFLVLAIVGCAGGLLAICTVIYLLWTGACFGHKKVHSSVQPTITRNSSNAQHSSSPPSRSSTIRRQGSRVWGRQRSGTSGMFSRQRSGTSAKHTDRAEEFTFADLVAATDSFSLENKIGAGSFGIVYKGKLPDGREVAIKRGETGTKLNKFQEKESAFDSELSFLSRLHHKHLVRLVGYCEEGDERLLVYDYMKNGALYNHLHDKNNVEKSSSLLNSWKMRIKIALDAARGIEYLHNYAVPPIIHRDIKSSNILLDANWTARVSDFGLSLHGPQSDRDYKPMKAAGTVGYIDPEYYGLNVLTAKSDVYGLGIVLLEILSGKRAIFKSEEKENGGTPISVVDFAVPVIMAGELMKILDPRVGQPELNEAEAVELVAYTAMHCVNLEGKDRPTMTDIVANLERALALCDDSYGSISSGPISIISQ